MRQLQTGLPGQAFGPEPLFVMAGRPAIVTALGFAAGSAFYFSLPAEPSTLWGYGLTATSLIIWLVVRAGRQGGAVALALLCLFALTCGFARAQYRSQALAAEPVAALTLGRPATITGWVEAIERNGAGRTRLSIRLPHPGGAPVRRVRVLANPHGFEPGDAISIRAVVDQPRRAPVPGSYDFRFNAYFAGIAASGYAIATPVAGPKPGQDALARAIARWRGHIAQHLRQRLPGRNGAMAAALLTGDRSGLAPEVSATLRAAGLGHILAISGMHMALLAGGVFLALRFGLAAITPWARRFDAAIPAAIGALIAAAAYFLLSGGAIPTQRAFLMTAAVLTGLVAGRRALSLHTLALAMIFVLALQPEAIRAAGFQMSFAAVAALIATADLWRQRRRPAAPMDAGRSGVLTALGGLSLTSLIAGLATAGFAAFHFHRIAGFGLLGNWLAMPVFTFIVMPAGALALCLMPFGLDQPALWAMSWGLDVMFAVADRVSAAPGALQPVIAAPGWILPLYAFGFVTLLLGRGPVRAAGAAPALLALTLWSLTPAPDIFVSEDGIIVARSEQDPGHWTASSTRRGRFAVKVFLEQRAVRTPAVRADLHCDDLGCSGEEPGLNYVLLSSAEDWAVDCQRAALVVLTVDLPSWLKPHCRAPVIDREFLRQRGGTLIWARDGAIVRTQSVSAQDGDRPWERRMR